MYVGFRCKCGHEADLLDFCHPGLKPWELRCPGCGSVISKRHEVPESISDEELALYRRYGVPPGKVVVEVKPQLELAV